MICLQTRSSKKPKFIFLYIIRLSFEIFLAFRAPWALYLSFFTRYENNVPHLRNTIGKDISLTFLGARYLQFMIYSHINFGTKYLYINEVNVSCDKNAGRGRKIQVLPLLISHPSLFKSHCWPQASSQSERASYVIARRAQCVLFISHTILNYFAFVMSGAFLYIIAKWSKFQV